MIASQFRFVWFLAAALVLQLFPWRPLQAAPTAASSRAPTDRSPHLSPEQRRHTIMPTFGLQFPLGQSDRSAGVSGLDCLDDDTEPPMSDDDPDDPERPSSARGFRPRRPLGLRYTFAIRPAIALEAEVITTFDPNPRLRIAQTAYLAHVVLSAPHDRFVPFVLIGPAVRTGRDLGPGLFPGADVGMGMAWYFGHRWLARMDARYTLSAAPPNGDEPRVAHLFEWNIGVGVVFGRVGRHTRRGTSKQPRPSAALAARPIPKLYEENDACPLEDETWNGYQDDDGCPDERPADAGDELDALIDAAVGPPARPAIASPPLPRLAALHFDDNDARLRVEARTQLDEVAAVLTREPSVVLLITGHADARGAPGYNFDLSLRRASAVRQHLIQLGIDPHRLIAHAMSEVEARARAERMSEDRRVELELFRR